jgi:Family of unknown function (DUF6011)
VSAIATTAAMRGRLGSITDARIYTLLGNARLTLVSVKTGTRFTYRVRQPGPEKPHFIQLLSGSDNEADYAFLGTIFKGVEYRHGRRSRIGAEAPSARAFAWFWGLKTLPPDLEVWHEGRCGRCGRALTVPESIARGIGPECAKSIGEESPSRGAEAGDLMDLFTPETQRREAEEEIVRMNHKLGFPAWYRSIGGAS